MEKDIGVFENAFHFGHVVDEIRGEISFVELHTFDDVVGRFGGLAFFDGDNAVVADRFHRVGEELTDLWVVISADRADVGDLFFGRNLLGHFLKLRHGGGSRFIDTATNRRRIAAGGDVAQTFAENSARENGSGRRTVADDVVRLRSHFVHELRAHIFEGIFKLNFFTNGNAVFGNLRAAVSLAQHDVSSGRTKGNRHDVGQLIDAVKHLTSRRVVEDQLLCHEI